MNARKAVFVLACIGLLTSSVAMGATPVVSDVALAPGGTLVGQVLNEQGFAIPNTQVMVRQPGQEVVTTVTNREGKFAVSGLRGGPCQVVAANNQSVFRLWTVSTAPPAAKANVLMVSGQTPVVRANFRNKYHQWGLPVLAAGGIVAGVAIATSNSDDPSSP